VRTTAANEPPERHSTISGRDPKALIRYAIAMTALAAIVLWAAYIVRDALLIVYVSVLLSIGFSPIVRIIERQKVLPVARRLPRWLAILVLYVAIIGTVAIVISLVFPPLVEQATALWQKFPDLFERAQAFLMRKGLLNQHVTMREAVAAAPGSSGDAVGKVAGAVANVAGGVFGVITILILTFYMLVDSGSLRQQALRLFPKHLRERANAASLVVMEKISAWLIGQLLLAGTIGASSAIGLWALGIPFFYVLALLSAIGEMIPIVGPILSAIPAIAVASTLGLQKVIAVIIFFLVQQQLENHILVPKIMSRQVGVSPVTVIISLLIGGALMGVVGALLAVPTAAILQVIAAEIVENDPGGQSTKTSKK
jgi:predicted PurR-regulated permease PerM